MILQGRTLKGKNKIRELGNEWTLIKTRDTVGFSGEKGPWWLVAPISNIMMSRWIHSTDDKDFKILNS